MGMNLVETELPEQFGLKQPVTLGIEDIFFYIY